MIAREHPALRAFIIRADIRPYPSPEAWDCHTVWQDGKQCDPSVPIRRQIRRMLLEGYFDNPRIAD